jgi:hypothetical protein
VVEGCVPKVPGPFLRVVEGRAGVEHSALKKGVTVKVTCARACNASASDDGAMAQATKKLKLR